MDKAPLTKPQFDAECAKRCQHCAASIQVRLRADSGEYVHDKVLRMVAGGFEPQAGHTLCGANNFRKQQALLDGRS